MELNFRKLRADEIDCRVATVKEGKGVSLLLYKDARVDMTLLDETVGPTNWTRSHRLIGDRLYCTISIYDADKQQWIAKEDVGTESFTEKEKGQASDSFKRAGFNWNIGRELYTAPFIWINGADKYLKAHVMQIGYDDRGNINHLVIADHTNKVIFNYGKSAPQPTPTPKIAEGKVSSLTDAARVAECKTLDDLKNLYAELSKANKIDAELQSCFTARKQQINGTQTKQ